MEDQEGEGAEGDGAQLAGRAQRLAGQRAQDDERQPQDALQNARPTARLAHLVQRPFSWTSKQKPTV